MTLRQILLTVALVASAGPLEAQTRWRLDEIARIGGDDEGLASFNEIIDVQLGNDGKIWVLDRQTQSLRLFAADGTPIKEVARRGRGPGELSNANGVRRGPDGRMWVRDHSNQRLTSYGPDGTLIGQHMVPSHGYGWRWDGALDSEGRVLDIIGVRRGERYERVITRYRPDLSQADTIALPTTCSDLPPPRSSIAAVRGYITFPFAARFVMVPSSDGALWCANSDEYRPRRFPFGAARHDRELLLTPPRVPIPRAERDSAIAAVDSFLARQGGAIEPWPKGDVPRDRGAFGWMEVDDQGRLWVRRELPDRSYEFDVWDVTGRRIAVVPAPGGADFMPLYRVVGDRLVTIVTDEDDLPYVVVYRIRTS
jgi:sugar lactone lactonase YvrE